MAFALQANISPVHFRQLTRTEFREIYDRWVDRQKAEHERDEKQALMDWEATAKLHTECTSAVIKAIGSLSGRVM